MARSRLTTRQKRAKAKRDAWNASVRRLLPPPEPLDAVKEDAEWEMRQFDRLPPDVRHRIANDES
jgi:hypothetical protein